MRARVLTDRGQATAGVPARGRARRCGLPAAHALERHGGPRARRSLRRAPAHREGARHRAAPGPAARRRVPAPDRARARRRVRTQLLRSRFAAKAEIASRSTSPGLVLGGAKEVLRRSVPRRKTRSAEEDIERWRIEAGIPRWGREIDKGRSSRPKQGLDETHISFSKGVLSRPGANRAPALSRQSEPQAARAGRRRRCDPRY